MSLITEKPDNLESTNELDKIDDPETDEAGLSIDRYLAFGTTPRAIVNPPKRGHVVTYQVKVECVGESWKERSDGEIRYSSDLNILSVARVGEELPPDFKSKKQQDAEAKAAAKAAAKGKGLYDNPDEPPIPGTDPAAESEAADGDSDSDAPEPASGVETPAFSDAQKKPARRGRLKSVDNDPTGAAEHAAEAKADGRD